MGATCSGMEQNSNYEIIYEANPANNTISKKKVNKPFKPERKQ
jgi:hypothetical protein